MVCLGMSGGATTAATETADEVEIVISAKLMPVEFYH